MMYVKNKVSIESTNVNIELATLSQIQMLSNSVNSISGVLYLLVFFSS